MIDTIFFDNWNTLVQAPNLMKRGSSTRIFFKHLLNHGTDISYESFIDAYFPISSKQVKEADYGNLIVIESTDHIEESIQALQRIFT